MMSLGFSDCSTSILFCTSLCLLETSLMWNKATFSSSWKQIKPKNHISVTDKTESVCAGFHTVSHQVGFGRRFSGPLRGKKNQETCFFFESNFGSGGFVSCPVDRMKCWTFLLMQFVCVTGYVSYWHFYKTCHIMFTSHGCDLAWWSGRSRKGCWASDNSSRLCFNIIKSETTRYF